MELLSGNEAIAQGAWEAGATIGAGYPGTPSTEALESFAQKDGVQAEWCTNEKVALEVGLGASAAGARVLVTMKHVGLNVAADPLFTAAYTGVGAGLVILSADDPGMHSSQNEQDSRFYALAARVPILEPANSAEALSFTKEAFDLSERFDTPVLVRSTVRISHAKTLVTTGQRRPHELREYVTDQPKWVMMPAFAKSRRTVADQRVAALMRWVETCPYNQVDQKDSPVGVVCSGAVFQHVKEALPDASVLKLGVSWPLPAATLERFAASVDRLYVIDEASDYLSSQIRALGIEVTPTPAPLPVAGELTPGIIRSAFLAPSPTSMATPTGLPGRPPALCAGCSHRLVFKELARIGAIVTGDIGCYTLAALPPLKAMDTCVDMGASVSMAHGFELALAGAQQGRPVVAVIGDSTFTHSGVASLMNTVYNRGTGTVLILDNRTTAMTGRQGNPVNGQLLQGSQTAELDLEALVKALGVADCQTVDPHDMRAVRRSIKAAIRNPALSVLIFRAPCVLVKRQPEAPVQVTDSCNDCGVCLMLGCPAISRDAVTRLPHIDQALCVGCGQCEQYCAPDAIALAAKPTPSGQQEVDHV
ncbi:MAG: thiamine pyrophosphate-dependent enzyme [Micrococcales bacterium]|nr:thiamine pyrophosphate-dependent enzyme [Micrococcales bacterium]